VLDSQTHAIVVMSALPLQERPNADSKENLVLHEGMKVQLLDSVDNWIQVKIDEDTDGWVDRNGLVTI
jgi:SH3-like domain-containing protein